MASLTQHRAEKSGHIVPTIYDTPYRKGERINCDDPAIAYIVRIGKVRVKKQMDTQTGPNLVTVDFLDKDMPLIISRFIGGAKDDPELQFFADTDVIIGEFPIALLRHLLDQTQFYASFARTTSDHVQSLRKALFSQLERNQKKLEELEEQRRQKEAAQRKLDELADENLGLQMDLGEAQQTTQAALKEVERVTQQRDELEKKLAAAQRKIETLRTSNEDLRKSQEALRQSHDEEIERIAKLSKERYAELRFRRDLDKARERRRWQAIENLLARLGNPLLLPEEIASLVDDEYDAGDLPAAEPPTITEEDVDALNFFGEEEVMEVEDDELKEAEQPLTEDESHIPTIIPSWIPNESPRPKPDLQPPASCPQTDLTPRPRMPMETLDLDVNHTDFVQESVGRSAINPTAPLNQTFKPEQQAPPPLPQTPQALPNGVRTAVMPAIVRPPRPSQVSDPKIETRYRAADDRWSWPDNEPLFPPEEPTSQPISCPIAAPFADIEAIMSETTKPIDVRGFGATKPKK